MASKRSRFERNRKIALYLVQRLWNRIPKFQGGTIRKPMLERVYLMTLAPWERKRWYQRRAKLMQVAQRLYQMVATNLDELIRKEEFRLARDGSHIHLAT